MLQLTELCVTRTEEYRLSSRALKGRYHIKKRNGKVIALAILGVLVAAIIACFVGASALARTWLEDLPDHTNLESFNTAATSTVYASDGTTVLAEFQLENRDPVEADQISDYVYKGTVATEDERFYTHTGVDLYGTTRALVNNMLGRSLEGGSTITQQLVRNTILSEEMTEISFKRKIREMYLATKLEEQYSKDEILLMYLNTINYGSGAYGIEAASERYFSKHASELTLAEAATLVGIPQSPTYNNPIDNPDACLERRNTVLDRMVSNGYITAEEAEAAKAQEIVLQESKPSDNGLLAYPYFTSYVRNQLFKENGKYDFSVADVFEGGLNIITTLDVDDQVAAEMAANNKRDQVGWQYEVGLVAIDPSNGYIKAMVGGDDYANDQVNMATGEGSGGRQVGSSFKTFTLVAAIEAGIDPATMIDAGAKLEVPGSSDVYNYGKASYGTRSIESAFAVSSNTAFMRLIMSVGVDKVIDVAKRMGITSDMQHVAGLTLGIASLTPLEMADAYATIANGGIHYDPECIIKITDRNGNVIVDNSNPEGERVLSEEVACAAIPVMEGVVTSGTGTEARLANGQPAAGKTGTTEEEKDSWFVGITPQMSVAIWLGQRADNYADAAPIFQTATSVFADFMNMVLEGQPVVEFPTADAPEYDKDFKDEKNHIGKGTWVGNTEDDKKAEEEAKKAEEDANKNSSASSSSDTSSGESGGGGGGETPTPPDTPDPPPTEPDTPTTQADTP